MAWCYGLFKGSILVMYEKRKLLHTAATNNRSSPFRNILHFTFCEPRHELPAKSNAMVFLNESKTCTNNFLYWNFRTPAKIVVRFSSILLTLYRLAKLIIIFTPVMLSYPFALINARMHDMWWQYFLFSIQISGPVFVKLSQWASTRRDMFSLRTCMYLSSFQRNASSHTWPSTCHIMEKAFGHSWHEMFFEFNQNPVGSGCVAQVYHAYLKSDAIHNQQGKTGGIPFWKFWAKKKDEKFSTSFQAIPVAVKVLHPYIKREFEQNIGILKFCAKVVECILPSLRWLSLTDCVKEFENFMLSQIDLVHEAKMLEVFHKNFKAVENVNFPKPIWPYISSEVLIETWEEGVPISHFLSDNHTYLVRKKLAEIGVNVLLKMVFNDNFVHSDLHPGNILVQNADMMHVSHSKKINKPFDSKDPLADPALNPSASVAFVILDCGLVSSLSNADFSKFLKVFQAVALGQGEAVGELFLNHSVNECQNPEKFKTEMSEIVCSARKNTLSLGKVDVGKLLGNVFSLLTTHRIKLESNFASLMLAIMVLEGLGRSLDPTLDLIEKAKPYLFNNIYSF